MMNRPGVPLVKAYELICYVGLGIILLVQMEQRQSLVNTLVVAIGVLGVVLKLRVAPILLFGSVAVSQIAHFTWMRRFRFPMAPTVQLTDILLALGIVAYIGAHYRLQGIWATLLTIDPRRRPESRARGWWGLQKKEKVVPFRRPADQVQAGELFGFLAWLPVGLYLGWGLWNFLGQVQPVLDIPIRWMRILWLVWSVGLGWWIMGILLNLWRQRRLEPGQAELYLQDALWQETRGEQRRIERWRAWEKLEEERTSR